MGIFKDGLGAALKVADQVKGIKNIDLQDIIGIIPIIENIWDKKTLAGLLAGQLIVQDAAINSGLVLARKNNNREDVGDIVVKSLTNNQLKLDFSTTKWGTVQLHCRILELKHNGTESLLKIELLYKKLLDKPMLSWIFSIFSLSMFNKIFGDIELGKGLDVDITGNIVTIDFRKRLMASKTGSFEVGGFSLLDTVVVTGVATYDGYVVLQAGLKKKEKNTGISTFVESLHKIKL